MTPQSYTPVRTAPLIAPFAHEAHRVGPWSYLIEEQRDEDVVKIHHWLVHEDTGETIRVDFDPYGRMTPEDIRRWLDLGKPGRLDRSPLRPDQLELHWWRQFGPQMQRALGVVRSGLSAVEVV